MLAGLRDFGRAGLPPLNGALNEIAEIKKVAEASKVLCDKIDYLPAEQATKENVKKYLPLATYADVATHAFAQGNAVADDTEPSSTTDSMTASAVLDSLGHGDTGSSKHSGTQAADQPSPVPAHFSEPSRMSATGTRSADTADSDVVRFATRSDGRVQVISTARDPLIECGLYLAYPKHSGRKHEDSPNLLTAEEIVELDLSKCELLTLSACQTGLGRRLSGQGVVGLRSAIIGAGARSVLMSLWSVDDNATCELMKRFYGYLSHAKHPISKVEALKKAQDYIRSCPQWQAPRYWAGWVLAGDGWQLP